MPSMYVKDLDIHWSLKYYMPILFFLQPTPVALLICKEVKKNSCEIAGFEIVFYTS